MVRAGDVDHVQSSGQIQMSDNAQDIGIARWGASRRMAPDAPVSGVLAGGLIAKIGGYAPVAIGDQTRITAPVSGELSLGVNDDHLPDNRGEFTRHGGLAGDASRRNVCATGGMPASDSARWLGTAQIAPGGHSPICQGLWPLCLC